MDNFLECAQWEEDVWFLVMEDADIQFQAMLETEPEDWQLVEQLS